MISFKCDMLSVIRCQSSPLFNSSKIYLLRVLPSTSYLSTTSILKANDSIWNKLSASSLVAASPKSCQPYLRLMRADKPIGTWLLYWPCTWSIALAASPGTLPNLPMLALFGTGAFLMRGAGCVINDLWDKDFDRRVERTKLRPLASGELSTKQSIAFLGGLLSISLGILLQLNLPTIVLGFTSMIPVICYPLAKRFTYWPQSILGLTFNYGALMGYSAVAGTLDPQITLPLYLSAWCWTMVYDTIYAHQDKDDDVMIGVKSTAIRFGENTQLWLSGFSAAMISGLLITGINASQTWPYFVACSAAAAHLAWQIKSVNINSREDCWKKFVANQWIGILLFGGIVAGTLLKEERKEDSKMDTVKK